jgi:cytochrome c biogenesis protein
MISWLHNLSSLKFTLVGMVLLGIGAGLSYGNPIDVSVWVLIVPLALLAINLAAAILTNPRINRQPGLLVFHVCLFSTVVLAGVGRLTHLDAHMEIANGQEFHENLMLEVLKGPWHAGNLDKVAFTQGPYTVDYAAGLRRGLTHSEVMVTGSDGRMEKQDVGDDRPLVQERYRFYTTHNKGFSPIMTWVPDQGPPITGRINMPSYPLYDYKQDNRWIPPGTKEEIKFWLQLDTGLTLEKDWVLDGRNSSAMLVVTSKDQRVELNVGEETRLENGRLRYDQLTTWMGYRVFYDPTIQWLFYVTMAGVFGLTHFFWKKLNLAPWMDEDEPGSNEEVGKVQGNSSGEVNV